MWDVEPRTVSVSFSVIICVFLCILCGSSFCCLVFRVWRIVHHAVLGRLSRFSCLCNSVWVTVPKNSRSCCRCDSNHTDKTKTGFFDFFLTSFRWKNKMHTGGVTSESRVNHMWRLEKDFGANQVHSSALGDRLRLCEVWLVTCVWSCSCGTMWNSPSGKCFSCALLENLW